VVFDLHRRTYILKGPLRKAARRLTTSGLGGTLGWALASALASQGLNIANSVILGRILKAEGFGLYNLLLLTTAIGSSVGSFGLGVTATRFIASERGRGSHKVRALVNFILGVTSVISLACGLLFVMIAAPLANYVAAGHHLERAMKLSSLYLVGSSVDLVLMGVLIGFERFKALLVTGVIKGLSALLLCFFWARADGVAGAVVGLGFMSLFGATLNFVAVRRSLPARPLSGESLGWGERREILRFSLPIMLASLLVNPSTWLGSVIVNRQMGGSTLLAEFAVVRNWMTVLQFFPIQIAQAMLPFLSRRMVGEGETQRTSHVSIVMVTLIAAVLAVVTLPLGWWFIHLYGFSGSSLQNGFVLMLGASVFAAMNTILGQVVLSQGRSWPRLLADLTIAVTFVASVSLLTIQFQPVALAAATALSFLAGTMVIGSAYMRLKARG
jgi:O-antigen/teichoic acid export membrane protein